MRKEHSFQQFFSDFFPIFIKIFSDFWPKNFKKLSKLPSACADEQVLAWKVFLKILNRFGFSEELWHGSQTSIYVSRVKISEELVFFVFLLRFFSNFAQKLFKLLAKSLQEVVKTTFCVCRRTIFGLKKLSKVLNRFGFSAETFGMVLKVLYKCPE